MEGRGWGGPSLWVTLEGESEEVLHLQEYWLPGLKWRRKFREGGGDGPNGEGMSLRNAEF